MNVITELGAWDDSHECEVDDPVQRLEVGDEPPECEILYQFHRSKIAEIIKMMLTIATSVIVAIAAQYSLRSFCL